MLEERLRADLSAAMRERDRARVTVLRTALAAIANAEAPAVETHSLPSVAAAGSTEVARLELTDDDRRRILRAQIADRHDTVDQYEHNGRDAEPAVLRSEIRILTSYLE
jgi:hypothetical protein